MAKNNRLIMNGNFKEKPQLWNTNHIHDGVLILVREEKDCPVPQEFIQKDNKHLKYIQTVQKQPLRFDYIPIHDENVTSNWIWRNPITILLAPILLKRRFINIWHEPE